jgi:trimeric autotransporter adhesin
VKRSLVSIFLIAGLAGMLPAQTTFTISTVGGSASNGLGDGGNAAGATLITPIDVVVDAAGNVYISDSFGASINTTAPFGTNGTGLGRIRKIDATSRNISTLTLVTTDPKGIALDATGKFLYVADNGNQRIRKVDTTTGATTTFAGTGSADMTNFGRLATQVRFRNPRAVWVDANGNVYFTDTQNSRVSRVDGVTGIISLVAGRGTANSSQATALSAAAAPGGDGGPGPQGQLWSPEGVVGDNNGNLYIADTGANRIRKVVLSCTGQPVPCTVGTISTVVGLGTAGAADNVDAASAQLSGPRGLAMDATGANLYIADSGNNRIRKWVVASCGTTVNGVLTVPPVGCNQVSTVAGSGAPRTGVGDGSPALVASLANPTGVSLDSAGNIYIADQNNSRIRVVDATTGIITTLTGASQSRGDSGPASLATFSNPRGVAVDLAGNVYVTDTNNQKVRKIAANGTVTTYVGTGSAGNGVGAGTSTPLNFPGCVAVDQTGTVYIADRVNSKIKRVDVYGNVTNVVSSNTATVSKTGVVTVGGLATGYNGDGGPAVADKVGIVTSGGGFLSSGSSSNTAGANCVSVDNNGNLYIADTGNNVIRKVDSNGILTTVVGYPTVTISNSGVASNSGISGSEGDGGQATAAQLNAPQGVGVDPTGTYLCIADTGNNVVREVNLQTGIIITAAGIIPDGGSDALPANGWQSRLNGPQGCAMDANFNIYIADTANNRITMVTAAGQMSIIAGGGSTFGGDGKAATAAQVTAPVGIAVDSKGDVFFTDRFGLIRELTPNK